MGPSLHSTCGCGDSGDSEEPGPAATSTGVTSDAPPASHDILPGLGCSGGGGEAGTHSQHCLHHPTPPPPKWGASAPGWCEAGRLRHKAMEPSLGFMGVGRSHEGFLLSPSSCPPLQSLLNPPNSSPHPAALQDVALPGCPLRPKRPLQLITPSTPHCSAPNHTIPGNIPPHWKT